MRTWSIAVLLACTALHAPHAQAPALEEATVVALVAKLPAFAAPGPRRDVVLRRQMAIPDSDGDAHFVEITWKEAGASRTALLAVIRTARLDPDMPALASHDGWSLARVQEDADWDTLIRDLKEARDSARSASAVGNVRTMVSAQMTFAAIAGNGAYAAELKCLVTPRACGVNEEPLLFESFPAPDRMGYRYTLTPTGAVSALPSGARTSAGFVFTAVPIDEPSLPSFCTDQDGVVCRQPPGTPLVVSGAKCPAACEPLR
jgi:hypothetical protein